MTAQTVHEQSVPADLVEPPSSIPGSLGEEAPEDLGGVVTLKVKKPVLGARYDPRRHRERLRSLIAVVSLALFSAVVLIILLAVVVGGQDWDHLQGVTTALLPTVTAVVSSAIGFYYGTRARTS